MSEGEREQ